MSDARKRDALAAATPARPGKKAKHVHPEARVAVSPVAEATAEAASTAEAAAMEFAPTTEEAPQAFEGIADADVLAVAAALEADEQLLRGVEDAERVAVHDWPNEMPSEAICRMRVGGLALKDMLTITSKPAHVLLRVNKSVLPGTNEIAQQISVLLFEQRTWASVASIQVDAMQVAAVPDASQEFFEVSLAALTANITPLMKIAKSSISLTFYPHKVVLRAAHVTVTVPVLVSVKDTLNFALVVCDADAMAVADTSVECDNGALECLCAFASKGGKSTDGVGGLMSNLEFLLFDRALVIRCGSTLSLVIPCVRGSAIGAVATSTGATTEELDEEVLLSLGQPTHTFTAPTLYSVTSLLPSGTRIWIGFRDCEQTATGTQTAMQLQLYSTVLGKGTRTCHLHAAAVS